MLDPSAAVNVEPKTPSALALTSRRAPVSKTLVVKSAALATALVILSVALAPESDLRPTVGVVGATLSIVNAAAALDEAVLPARSVIETVACGVPSASTVPAGKATCHLPAASTGVSTLTAAAPLASSIESFELGSAVPASTGLVTLVRPSVELRPESLSLSPTDPEAMPIVGAVTLESKVNV